MKEHLRYFLKCETGKGTPKESINGKQKINQKGW